VAQDGYILASGWGSLDELLDAHVTGGLCLDLGCGYVKREGYIGIDDLRAQPEEVPPGGTPPDILMDLNAMPLPFADSSIDEIVSSHFLEHSNVPHVLAESHRVLKPQGVWHAAVPYANSAQGMYPGHTIFFTERWFHESLHFQELFEIVEERFEPGPDYERLPRVVRRMLPFDLARTFLFNVCHQMHIVARARKPSSAEAPPQRPSAVVSVDDYGCSEDGLATRHLSPFLEPEERGFAELYERVAERWIPGTRVDARWRAWLLTRFARSCRDFPRREPADFAEFGTYRAAYAELILESVDLSSGGQRLHLFDTFEGTPAEGLTARERQLRMAGRWNETSTHYVREALAKWESQLRLWPGDVRDTLRDVETGPLAFVHVDLNAAEPTGVALAYAYDRLVPGGMIVFDDYGYGKDEYADQRNLIDRLLSERGEEAIALPTGQALLIRRNA
jgi:SAM-dependent methyltransferase